MVRFTTTSHQCVILHFLIFWRFNLCMYIYIYIYIYFKGHDWWVPGMWDTVLTGGACLEIFSLTYGWHVAPKIAKCFGSCLEDEWTTVNRCNVQYCFDLIHINQKFTFSLIFRAEIGKYIFVDSASKGILIWRFWGAWSGREVQISTWTHAKMAKQAPPMMIPEVYQVSKH